VYTADFIQFYDSGFHAFKNSSALYKKDIIYLLCSRSQVAVIQSHLLQVSGIPSPLCQAAASSEIKEKSWCVREQHTTHVNIQKTVLPMKT